MHDLDALATQLENAYRGRARGAEERKRFAAAIRELDGNTRAAHLARCQATPVEMPERTAARIGCAMRLQTMWLRWYAGRNPEMQDAATEAGKMIAAAAGLIEEMRGFGPHRPRASGPGAGVGRRGPVGRDRVRPGERAGSVTALVPGRSLLPSLHARTADPSYYGLPIRPSLTCIRLRRSGHNPSCARAVLPALFITEKLNYAYFSGHRSCQNPIDKIRSYMFILPKDDAPVLITMPFEVMQVEQTTYASSPT